MTKVLGISSQVVFGPVGNTAAVPALQAAGFVVMQLPTVLLSAHPGHGRPVVQTISDATFADMLDNLWDTGRCQNLLAVMTGYFATPNQVSATAAFVAKLRVGMPDLYILVDPVIGDEGGLYVSEAVAHAIKDLLLPLANCITPNRFELAWLSGETIGSADDVRACALPAPEILATSIPADQDHLLTIVKSGKELHITTSKREHGVPHGTGDFLSGLYLSSRLHRLPAAEALKLAILALKLSIAASLQQPALDLEPGLRAMRRFLECDSERPNL